MSQKLLNAPNLKDVGQCHSLLSICAPAKYQVLNI